MKEGKKVLSINMPVSLIDFFEDWAKQELEDDNEGIDWVSLSKRRNELMINCLSEVIEGDNEV